MHKPKIMLANLETAYRYLSQGSGTLRADAAVLFGRHDMLVPMKGAEVFKANGSNITLVPTGGIGKDSGHLKVAEATWIEKIMRDELPVPVPQRHIFTETKASNGGENARYSLVTLGLLGLKGKIRDLATVIHATSALRLACTMQHEAKTAGWNINLVVVPTDYKFDPTNEADQREVVGELLRLHLYGLKGMLELPQDMHSLRMNGCVQVRFHHVIELGKHFAPELYDQLMAELKK